MPSEFVGREVACSALTGLFEALDARALDTEALTEGLPYPADHFRDTAARIDWASFTTLLERVAERRRDAELREAGVRTLHNPEFRTWALAARLLLQPADAYRYMALAVPGRSVACLQSRLTQHDRNHLEITIDLQPGYAWSVPFSQIFLGAVEEVPTLMGLPRPEVDMRPTERGARYDIRLTRVGLLARLRRVISRQISMRASAIQIKKTQQILYERTEALEHEIRRRTHVEALLRDGADRYRRRLENTNDVIIEFDERGRLEYLSPNVEKVFGYSVEDLASDPFRTVHPDDREGVVRSVDSFLKTGSPRIHNYRTADPGGEGFRYIESTASSFQTPEGKTHFLSVIRDVTGRRRAEDEARRMEQRLQETQKLESLGVLTGGVAHDFNNLLVPILGNASLALASLDENSKARANIEQIETAALRASELTKQMLAYAGRARVELTCIDLAQVVGEMVQLLEAAVPKLVDLSCHLEEGCFIEADAAQLRQVIMNLIINSAEAIGERRGRIRLRVAGMPADRACLEVRDDGCGMDEATRERMLEPFFSTKFAGRGLGLCALGGILRGGRAQIEVETLPDRGTRLQVVFPRRSAPEIQPAPESDDWREWRDGGTILVVDDEETVRGVAEAILEEHGLSLLMASDGREGVEVFRKHAARISAVLLDVKMPEMSGEQAFQEMRRIRPDVPVLLVSGFGEDGFDERIQREAGVALLGKPYRPQELVTRLRDLM